MIDLTVLAIDAQEGKSLWLVAGSGIHVCGSNEALEAFTTDRSGVILKTNRGNIVANTNYQEFFLNEGSKESPINISELLEMIENGEITTGVQAWSLSVDDSIAKYLFQEDYISSRSSKMRALKQRHLNYKYYFVHCIPFIYEDYECLDPYEGMDINLHTYSEGEEMYFPNLEKYINKGFQSLWTGGCEIYNEVYLTEPSIKFACSAQDLAKFSQVFTNWIEKIDGYDKSLVWLDDSGGFKIRCPFIWSKSMTCWGDSVQRIENGFGFWHGFHHEPDKAFYFQSCHGNSLLAVPDSDAKSYEISVVLAEGRKSCSYLDFFIN